MAKLGLSKILLLCPPALSAHLHLSLSRFVPLSAQPRQDPTPTKVHWWMSVGTGPWPPSGCTAPQGSPWKALRRIAAGKLFSSVLSSAPKVPEAPGNTAVPFLHSFQGWGQTPQCAGGEVLPEFEILNTGVTTNLFRGERWKISD